MTDPTRNSYLWVIEQQDGNRQHNRSRREMPVNVRSGQNKWQEIVAFQDELKTTKWLLFFT